MKKLVLTTTFAASIAASVSAQITLLEYGFLELQGDPPAAFNYTVTGATDNSVLAFGFYTDGNSNGFDATDFSTDNGTIGGMLIGKRGAMGYIADVSTSDVFNITTPGPAFGTGYSGMYFAVLNGVDLSNPINDFSVVSPDAASIADPLPTIELAENGYVFHVSSTNRNTSTPDYTGSDLTSIAFSQTDDGQNDGHLGSYSVAIASISGASAGTYTLNGANFSGTNERDHDGIAYSFNAVPEPSAYALLAGMLVLGTAVVRRRR